MPLLFSAQGEAALAALLARRPLLAFDFDGTLAPIVARPQEAQVPPAVAARLAALSGRLVVAIVTGRSVDDVRPRLGFVPQHVVGNHGAEDERVVAGDSAGLAGALEPLRELVAAQAQALAQAGVEVEDKALSMALHYRLAPRPAQALALIRSLTSSLPPSLRVFDGKMVVNLMAVQAPDKADAVWRLQRRCDAASVFYAGDDVNDEPVFAGAPAEWLTVRIGDVGPGEAPSRARYLLEQIDQMPALLDRMLAQMP